MKNHLQVNLFARLAQCLTLMLIVTLTTVFGQSQQPQKPDTKPPDNTQQKEPPLDIKEEVKQLPVAGP